MTPKDFKKIAVLLKRAYAEVQEEALNSGIDILSPEYDELIGKVRLAILEQAGFTLEQYQEIKAKIEKVTSASMLDFMQITKDRVQKIDDKHIPTEEEIRDIASDVANQAISEIPLDTGAISEIAERIAKKYIKEPVIKVIRETTIEQPRIMRETVKEIDPTALDEVRSNNSALIGKVGMIESSFNDFQENYPNTFAEYFQYNIDILGMPDFRKLAMGLQGQIDDLRTNGTSGGGSSSVGNTLYVDAVNGNDSSAARGTTRPFLDIVTAKNAAVSGDLIIVRPGTYSASEQLLKDGVDWEFEAGAIINMDTALDIYIFDDSAAGANGAVHSTIGGHGIFGGAGYELSIKITNTNSFVFIFMGDVRVAGLGLNPPSVFQDGGLLKIVADGNVGLTTWTNGEMHLDVEDLQGFNAVAASSANTQHVFLTCKTIGAMNIDGGSSASRFWVRCADTSNAAIIFDNARVYLTAQKSGYGIQCKMTGSVAQYWIDVEKMTGAALDYPNRGGPLQLYGGFSVVRIGDIDRSYVGIGGLESIKCTDGTHRVVVDSLLGNATGTDMITVSGGTLDLTVKQFRDNGGTANLLNVSGGTCVVDGLNYIPTTSGGIVVSAGTLRLKDSRLNTSAITTIDTLTVSGGTTILTNVTLVSHSSQNSIYAGSAQNVGIYGHCMANTDISSNITLTPLGEFTVDSSIT